MQLITTPDNPTPPGGRTTVVQTEDGVPLRVAVWETGASTPRGTLVLLQGRAEFIEKYFEVVGELLQRGFDIVTFDWRGQGGSGRSARNSHCGHVADFDQFRLDYQAVDEAILKPMRQPIHCLAHSMGACIALTGIGEGWLKADRLIASAPMIDILLVKNPRMARRLARFLTWIGLGEHFVPFGQARSISTLPFAGNRLCNDPRRYARNAALADALDWGAIGSPSVRWIEAAYEAMDRLAAPGFAARIDIPTLILSAGDDPVCSTPAIQAFARTLPHATYIEIPASRHEILMEQDAIRAIFWEAFDAFLAKTPERHPADA